MPFGLSTREQDRLAHILSRLESPFENERAIAGLLATEFLAKHGLSWSDLSGLAPQVAAPPVVPEPKPAKVKRQPRRVGSSNWVGYCRRRRRPKDQSLDVLV